MIILLLAFLIGLSSQQCNSVIDYGQLTSPAAVTWTKTSTTLSQTLSMSSFFTLDGTCTTWSASACVLQVASGTPCQAPISIATADVAAGSLTVDITDCEGSTGDVRLICADAAGSTVASQQFTFTLTIDCADAALYEIRTDGVIIMDKSFGTAPIWQLADMYRNDPSCPSFIFTRCTDDIGCTALTSAVQGTWDSTTGITTVSTYLGCGETATPIAKQVKCRDNANKQYISRIPYITVDTSCICAVYGNDASYTVSVPMNKATTEEKTVLSNWGGCYGQCTGTTQLGIEYPVGTPFTGTSPIAMAADGTITVDDSVLTQPSVTYNALLTVQDSADPATLVTANIAFTIQVYISCSKVKDYDLVASPPNVNDIISETDKALTIDVSNYFTKNAACSNWATTSCLVKQVCNYKTSVISATTGQFNVDFQACAGTYTVNLVCVDSSLTQITSNDFTISIISCYIITEVLTTKTIADASLFTTDTLSLALSDVFNKDARCTNIWVDSCQLFDWSGTAHCTSSSTLTDSGGFTLPSDSATVQAYGGTTSITFAVNFLNCPTSSQLAYVECADVNGNLMQSSTFNIAVTNCQDITQYTNTGLASKSHDFAVGADSTTWQVGDFFTLVTGCTNYYATSCSLQTSSGSPCLATVTVTDVATGTLAVDYSSCSESTGTVTLQCTNGVATINSDPFTLTFQCTAASTAVIVPADLQAEGVYTHTFDSTALTKPSFTFGVFSSAHTVCTLSSINLVGPSALQINGQNIEVPDLNLWDVRANYTFTIQGFAAGGATAASALMTVRVADPCELDTITVSSTSVSAVDDGFTYYRMRNGKPRMVLSLKPEDGQPTFNIANRFTSSQGCNFTTYAIESVKKGGADVMDYFEDFQLNFKGDFVVNGARTTDNFLVYISASNGFVSGGGDEFLIDYSYYYVAAGTFEEIRKVNKLVKTFGINDTVFEIDLDPRLIDPASFDNSDASFATLGSGQKVEVTIDREQMINEQLYFAKVRNIAGDTEYLIIIDNKPEVVIENRTETVEYIFAKVISIDKKGLLKLGFNDTLVVLEKEEVNSGNTQLQIVADPERTEDPAFKPSVLAFSWSIQDFLQKQINIKINFENPLQISTLLNPDQLVITLNTSIITGFDKKLLNPILRVNLPRQIGGAEAENFSAGSETANQVILVALCCALLLNLATDGRSKVFVLMTRSLQLMLHFPLLRIVFPQNVLDFMLQTIKIASFDFLDNYLQWDQQELLQFDFSEGLPILEVCENIDIESHNSILNLNTIAVVIGLLLLRLAVMLLAMLMTRCFESRAAESCYQSQVAQRVATWAYEGIFWNNLLGLTIEVLMDFIVASYLNSLTLFQTKISLDGEVLGLIVFTVVCLLTYIALPVFLIWLLFTSVPPDELRSEAHAAKYGVLYDELRIDTKFKRAYYTVFAIRRMVFLFVGLSVENKDYKILQLLSVFYLNIMNTIYIGHSRAWMARFYTRVEILNEWFVGTSGAILILYTEIGPEEELKYRIGWIHIGVIIVFLTYNLLFILYDFFRTIGLYIYWLWLVLNKPVVKKSQVQQEDSSEEVESPTKQQLVPVKVKKIDKQRLRRISQNAIASFSRDSEQQSRLILDKSEIELNTLKREDKLAEDKDFSPFSPKFGNTLTDFEMPNFTTQQEAFQDRDSRMAKAAVFMGTDPIKQAYLKFYQRQLELIEFGLHEFRDAWRFSKQSGMLLEAERAVPNSQMAPNILKAKRLAIEHLLIKNQRALKAHFGERNYDQRVNKFRADLRKNVIK